MHLIATSASAEDFSWSTRQESVKINFVTGEGVDSQIPPGSLLMSKVMESWQFTS